MGDLATAAEKGVVSNLICIDPGSKKSALVVLDGKRIEMALWDNNRYIVGLFWKHRPAWRSYHLVVETVQNYGNITGESINQSLIWSGRFIQAFCEGRGTDAEPFSLIVRPDVSLALCGHRRAKDAHLNAAIYDYFGGNGGGSNPAKGTKKHPGPLYGINNQHLRDAIAVGLAYRKLQDER